MNESLKEQLDRIERKLDEQARTSPARLERACYHAAKKKDCPYYTGKYGRCNCD
jgi:hypothetical protein